MGNLIMDDISQLLAKIRNIEKELSALKASVLKSRTRSNKYIVSVKGVLKGVDISEKEISNAKRSLYDNVEF